MPFARAARRRLALALGSWALVVTPHVLAAAPGPSAAAPLAATAAPSEPAGDWYGWQTLTVDAAALALGLGLAGSDLSIRPDHASSSLGTVASTLYFAGAFAAPAVHYTQGRAAVGAADLGLRLFVPPIVALLGMGGTCLAAASEGSSARGCAGRGASVGTLVGTLGVAALDGLAFGRVPAGGPVGRPRQTWYGWQVLLLDAAGAAAGIRFAAISDPPAGNEAGALLRVATGMYVVGFFGPPIVHLAHGRLTRALGDWAVRALLVPVIIPVGIMGHCAATGGASGCVRAGVEIGFLAGAVGAALFDATALSWTEAPTHPAANAATTMVPVLRVIAGGGLLGAAGAF